MSTVSSRPRVSTVIVTAAAGTVVAGAVVARSLLRAVGNAGRAVGQELQGACDKGHVELRPLSTVRCEQQALVPRFDAAVSGLTDVEALKVKTAARLSRYVIARADRVSTPLHALASARTVGEAREASDALLAAAETDHHRLFNEGLVAACTRASAAAGFHDVVTRADPRGMTRIVATSVSGAALVTEIHTRDDADPAMVTEVVGLHDGSCMKIMDRFDAALETEGVRTSAPQRRFTGGVCELAAARDFLRGKIRPKSESPADARTAPEPKRRLRRNPVTGRARG